MWGGGGGGDPRDVGSLWGVADTPRINLLQQVIHQRGDEEGSKFPSPMESQIKARGGPLTEKETP